MEITMYLIETTTGDRRGFAFEPISNWDEYTLAECVFELPEGYSIGKDFAGGKIIIDNYGDRCILHYEYNEECGDFISIMSSDGDVFSGKSVITKLKPISKKYC